MDWRAVSFDWNRARAFLVAAEEGSFSAAARALGSTQPTVGRQVAGLEAELDVTLFERVGKGVVLTPTGLDLAEFVRTMGDAALSLSLAAAGHSVSLEGPVCISASQIDATFTLPPIIAGLRERHPGIEIEIVATNDTSDLGRREADISICSRARSRTATPGSTRPRSTSPSSVTPRPPRGSRAVSSWASIARTP